MCILLNSSAGPLDHMPRQRARGTFSWCQYGRRFGTSARSYVESTSIQNNNNSSNIPRQQNLPSRQNDIDLCGKKRERPNCTVWNGCIRRRYIVWFTLSYWLKTWISKPSLLDINVSQALNWIYEWSNIWTVEKDMKVWWIIAVTHTTEAVMKFKSENKI